jgi:putative hydrolase of the HAD superfamily
MAIRAVFFDMGGTIETFSYTREMRLLATSSLKQQLLSAGINMNLGTDQLYEVISAGLSHYHHWRLTTLEELPTQRVWGEYILPEYNIDQEVLNSIAEELMFFIETQYYHREMRPEVPSVLDAIHKMGLKIGLISNVTSRGQVPTNLDLYHIRQYFNPIVLSSEYGRRKPDPAIFHHAARMANVPTSECLYIGDRIARDILGARKAGFRLAVQIKHAFLHGEEDNGATPDFVIHQMTELINILQKENNPSTSHPINAMSPSNSIRALVFDAGDILYYRPRRGYKLKQFLNELALDGENDNPAEIKALRQQAYRGKIDQDQYREGIIRSYGVTQPELVERGKQILEEEDNDVCFIEGVRKTLINLKNKGYLLAIVTDTAAPLSVKLNWFERGGFGHIWDSIVSSKELGVSKPDPIIYQAALQQLGLSAWQTVFIGHKASELEGARQVGMKTIAFNYEDTARADHYIDNFADLLKAPLLN